MMPSEVEQMARERYNAVGETFWSQSEIFSLIYAACCEIAQETKCIERTYETTTVADTQEYPYPTNTISIKRVTYDGVKLAPIDFRKSDSLTLNNTTTTITGTPDYYVEWNGTIILFPTPNDAKTLKVYSYNQPQAVTVTSSLEVPEIFHTRLVNYVLSEMYAKDKDFSSAQYYKTMWEQKDKAEIKKWINKRRRGDSFATVLDEDSLPNTILGFS